jgi:Hypoxia induced protein conserved region
MLAMGTQLTVISAVAVLVVLLLGLWNMMRRNSSPSLSQTLMRWRVGLQFVAVTVAMVALYLAR